MKKIILLMLSLSIIFSLASCGDNGGGDNGGGDNGGGDNGGIGDSPTLQQLLDEPKKHCFITVVTHISPSEYLTGTYELDVKNNGSTQIKVKLQQLSDFKLQNGVYKPSKNSHVNEIEAFYIIEDGEIVKNVGGSALEGEPTGELPKFNLNDAYLENVSESQGHFSATITDMKGFSGWDISSTNARVEIMYSRTAVRTLEIYYTNALGYETEIRFSYEA